MFFFSKMLKKMEKATLLCLGLLTIIHTGSTKMKNLGFQSCDSHRVLFGHALQQCQCYLDGDQVIGLLCEKASSDNQNDTAGFLIDFENDLEDPRNHDILQDSLEAIILRGYNFGVLPRNLIGIENYDQLMELDLTNNIITQLGSGTFRHMFQLKRLTLDDNELVFDGNHHQMFSSINKIKVLSLRRALNAEHAQTSVQVLKRIFDDSDLRDLEELYMNENNLHFVPSSTFQNLPDLRVLDLSRNQLTHIDGLINATCFDYDYSQTESWSSFKKKPTNCRLEVLNLSGNNLITIPASFLAELNKIPTFLELDVTGNKLQCDCDLIPFLQLLQQGVSPSIYVRDTSRLQCSGPDAWLDKHGRTIPGVNFTGKLLSDENLLPSLNRLCRGDLISGSKEQAYTPCPSGMTDYKSCSCVYDEHDVVILNCSTPNQLSGLTPLTNQMTRNVEGIFIDGQNISSLHLDDLLPSSDWSTNKMYFLHTLALPNNKIRGFEMKKNRGPFAATVSLKRLILDGNAIMLEEEIVQALQNDLRHLEYLSLKQALRTGTVRLDRLFSVDSFNNLEYLNLDGNNIKEISSNQTFKALPELQELHLENNNLTSVRNIISRDCYDYRTLSKSPNDVASPPVSAIINVNCKLRHLNLKNNLIQSIPGDFLYSLKSTWTFQSLDIRGNPIQCNSSTVDLWLAITNGTYAEHFTILHDQDLCKESTNNGEKKPAEPEKNGERKPTDGSFNNEPRSSKHRNIAIAVTISVVCAVFFALTVFAVFYKRHQIVENIWRLCSKKQDQQDLATIVKY